jgi:single-stranded DNA-binding protein
MILELKTSVQESPILRLSIATHTFRSGEQKTTHRGVMVFGSQAEICGAYLRKPVLVEGSVVRTSK